MPVVQRAAGGLQRDRRAGRPQHFQRWHLASYRVQATGVVGVAGTLAIQAYAHGPQTLWVGAWPQGFGIVLVADRLSALMLTVAALVCLALRQFAGSKLPAVVNDVLLVAADVCLIGSFAEINRVKHEALVLRRAIWPLREILNTLSRADNGFFTADTRLYLRDIYDHTVHVLESLESVRDLLADLLDIYLSSVSNRLNTEVRILTVLTTLFMPATLIAGVFGMNFHAMPLLDDPEGFWIALGVMGGAATVMAAAFWRRNWLRTR